MSHFEPAAWREFLDGGHVRTAHIDDIPIWAGFLITQVADLHSQIGFLLMTQAISLHDMFQGDLSAIQTAFNQLVSANTTAKAYSQQLLAQIAALQGQLADPNGAAVTSDDLTQLNTFAAQIQQAAASTVTTTPASTPTSTTATGSGSGTASASASGSATTPSTATSASSAPATIATTPATATTTTGSGSGAVTTSGAASAATAPVAINAGDSASAGDK